MSQNRRTNELVLVSKHQIYFIGCPFPEPLVKVEVHSGLTETNFNQGKPFYAEMPKSTLTSAEELRKGPSPLCTEPYPTLGKGLMLPLEQNLKHLQRNLFKTPTPESISNLCSLHSKHTSFLPLPWKTLLLL